MTELTMDQELRLIELEVKRLTFLYGSYTDWGRYGTDNPYQDPSQDPRQIYIGVAHNETSKMLKAFYEKWDVKPLT